MVKLSSGHYLGIAIVLVLMTVVGLYAGRKVTSAADFTTGSRKAGWPVVTGTIMGTLVSASSTVGTAQLAFQFGFSAWWFTLGAGISCLVLGLALARRFYESTIVTIPQYLVMTYGTAMGPVSSIFTSVGMFFNVVANVLSLMAMMGAMFHLSNLEGGLISLVLMLSYVVFGGIWGAGMTGVLKVGLLYVTMLVCGITAYFWMGGVAGLGDHFPAFPWFSLFGRGMSKDLAAGLSLLVGVISTQTYIQALASAKNANAARNGALASAVLIPPLGLGGIMVGLFMRAHFPDAPSSQVFPLFVMQFLPSVISGVVLATLLVTVVAGWAGLSLGITTMLTRDVYQKFVRPNATSRNALMVQRLLIGVVGLLAVGVASGNAGTLILSWGFLSMGLRGCTALLPLLAAMFCSRYVTPAGGVVAAFLGPLADFVWFLAFPNGMDPLYPGLVASLITLVVVSHFTRGENPSGRGRSGETPPEVVEPVHTIAYCTNHRRQPARLNRAVEGRRGQD